MNLGCLNNKIAIVTGGAGGIGREIVRTLARRGAITIIADLAEAGGLVVDMRGEGLSVESAVLDVTRADAVGAFATETERRHGQISILVNCAGGGERVGFVETTDAGWFADINRNLTGTFFMMRAVLPAMVRQRDGAIVNVSSISGVIGGLPSKGTEGRSGPAYAAAKGGIIALTKWAAREFGKHGVRVNVIAPGPVQAGADMAGYDYGTEDYPVPRFGTPTDMAEAVAYLASPASAYVTGECLKITGGVGM